MSAVASPSSLERWPWPPALAASPTLATNEEVSRRLATGQSLVHLGFGEAGLPVLPELAERLAAATGANAYAPVAGSAAARASAAAWFTRRGLSTEPGQVVFGPGSKSLLWAVIASLPGDVVLPVPCWVSYAAHAALAGRRVTRVPSPDGRGGIPDALTLSDHVRRARASGADPRIVVVTSPDNPTSSVAPPTLVGAVCAVARELDLVIISDEIYRDLAYHPDDLVSPAELAPERVVVTGGLSKSLALGGWRIGFLRVPEGRLGAKLLPRLLGIASETWSALASPMQEVAAWALTDPEPVRARIERSRRLHALVTTAVHRTVTGAGADCAPPQASFYLYPGFTPATERLARHGIHTGDELARQLLHTHAIAALPGEAFGQPPEHLRLRLSSSLLYGDSDQQRQAALESPDPASLPWIQAALRRIADAFASTTCG